MDISASRSGYRFLYCSGLSHCTTPVMLCYPKKLPSLSLFTYFNNVCLANIRPQSERSDTMELFFLKLPLASCPELRSGVHLPPSPPTLPPSLLILSYYSLHQNRQGYKCKGEGLDLCQLGLASYILHISSGGGEFRRSSVELPHHVRIIDALTTKQPLLSHAVHLCRMSVILGVVVEHNQYAIFDPMRYPIRKCLV